MRGVASAFVALAAAIFLSSGAGAVEITWSLVDVTFSDGGRARGSFVYDSDTDSVTSWDITLSGGDETTFPALRWTERNSAGFFIDVFELSQQTLVFDGDPGDIRSRVYRLTPINSYASTGSTALDFGGSLNGEPFPGSGNVDCFNCAPFRSTTAGSLHGVPEPGTLALLGLVLAALRLGARKANSTASGEGGSEATSGRSTAGDR